MNDTISKLKRISLTASQFLYQNLHLIALLKPTDIVFNICTQIDTITHIFNSLHILNKYHKRFSIVCNYSVHFNAQFSSFFFSACIYSQA